MACPMCDRMADDEFKPFCSKRCADLDLAKWLSGSYAIASDNPEEAEELYQELSEAQNKLH